MTYTARSESSQSIGLKKTLFIWYKTRIDLDRSRPRRERNRKYKGDRAITQNNSPFNLTIRVINLYGFNSREYHTAKLKWETSILFMHALRYLYPSRRSKFWISKTKSLWVVIVKWRLYNVPPDEVKDHYFEYRGVVQYGSVLLSN